MRSTASNYSTLRRLLQGDLSSNSDAFGPSVVNSEYVPTVLPALFDSRRNDLVRMTGFHPTRPGSEPAS